MGLFDNVKDSIKGSDSQNDGGGFDSGEFDSSFTSDESGGRMDEDPLDSPQNSPERGGQMNGPQNNSGSPRNSLEPSDPLESGNDPAGQGAGGQSQNDFQPQNDLGGGRNGDDSPNPRAGRPQEGGSSPQLSSDTKKEMKDAGFQVDGNQNDRSRGPNQGRDQGVNREQQGFNSDQGSVASNRDDLEEIKSQNQQIIELLKRISDALNSDQGGVNSGRNRHGGRR
jgi:hypothetical protein